MLDFPTGSVTPYSSPYGNLPTGWAACNGDAYNGTLDDYAPLYQAVGIRFGGSGASSFNVPNLGQRTVLSAITSSDVGGFKGSTTITLTSTTCGVQAHSHAVNETAHSHNISGQSHNHVYTYGADVSFNNKGTLDLTVNMFEGPQASLSDYRIDLRYVGLGGVNTGYENATTSTTTSTSGATSDGSPHNNLMPYLVVQYIIKL